MKGTIDVQNIVIIPRGKLWLPGIKVKKKKERNPRSSQKKILRNSWSFI